MKPTLRSAAPRCCQWLLASLLLAGCRLTSEVVEPPLPAVPVAGSATLVYRANGLPVVANNSTSLGTLLLAFFGDPRAVVAKLPASGDLQLRGTDVLNQPAGYLTHSLEMELPGFHGTGTYPLLLASAPAYAGASYQLTTYASDGSPIDHAEQTPVATTPAQVVVTDWDPSTRHLAGTFSLDVAGPNNPRSPTHLTEGRFDLTVD